jgi:WD40 repeat protein
MTEFHCDWFVFVFSVLADDTAGKDDLYIRSVCFSPDGKYLATGAEDKQIRVSGE